MAADLRELDELAPTRTSYSTLLHYQTTFARLLLAEARSEVFDSLEAEVQAGRLPAGRLVHVRKVNFYFFIFF